MNVIEKVSFWLYIPIFVQCKVYNFSFHRNRKGHKTNLTEPNSLPNHLYSCTYLDSLSHLRAVIVGALVAFPAATVDSGHKRHKHLLLIDLQGLVFHHAPSASTCHQSSSIPHRTGNSGGKKTITLQKRCPHKDGLQNPQRRQGMLG